MQYDRIVIWTSPTAPFQKLCVFKDGVIVTQMGIAVEDLNEVLTKCIEKYNINRLDFSGAHLYAQGLVKDFQEATKTKFKFGVNDIRINYV